MKKQFCHYPKLSLWLIAVLIIVATLLIPGSVTHAQSSEPQSTPESTSDSGSQSGSSSSQSGSSGSQAYTYNEAYYVLDRLNEGLPAPSSLPNLETPQATVERFIADCETNNCQGAGATLNLNLIAPENQAQSAPDLAHKLHYVMRQQLAINWGSLPDRPDGQVDSTNTNDPLAGQPQRSILLGTITLDRRDIDIRLQRVRVGDTPPIWVFSSQTVENIEPLYARYGPGWLDQRMPEWATVRVLGQVVLWEWMALLLLLIVSGVVGIIVRRLIRFSFSRVRLAWLRELGSTLALPAAFVVSLTLFYLAVQFLLSLTGPVNRFINPALFIAVIASVTWLGTRGITWVSEYVGVRYANNLESDDETQSRKLLTYISVARRVLILIALLVGAGVALSQFASLRVVGSSLLASAAVMSVIIGIAAQAVLGNILAGLQVAITQPVRIGDNVYFEDQWGYIEQITYTYITIRTWDERRVIVPLKYFITHPVENWSRTSSHLIKPIHLYLDYRTDVEQIRQKFDELLRKSDEWDEEIEPSVQVTNVSEEAIEVRALCSAKDPSTAWNLHCRLREELVAFVRDLEDGRYLPRQRWILEARTPTATTSNNHH
ncbi:MAG: mechanosensitive ion channel domain-containing protein [Chloroflexota bacterium]